MSNDGHQSYLDQVSPTYGFQPMDDTALYTSPRK